MLSRRVLCLLVSKQYRFRRDSGRGTTSRFLPDRHRKGKPRVRLLAFISADSQINRRASTEAGVQRYFKVAAPSLQQMLKALDQLGLIEK